MKTKKLGILSLSGGLDSSSLLIHLLQNNYEVKTLSFDYAQRHRVELDRVKLNINYLKSKGIEVEHNVIDLSILGKLFNSALTKKEINMPTGHYADENMKATVVPNRNAIFSSIVYGYALSQSVERKMDVEIFLAVHSGDHTIYPDCSPEFKNAIEKAFKIGNWGSERVNFSTPYINDNKTSILQDCIENCKKLNLDFNIIMSNTNTCYSPNEKGESCGKCGSCIERIESFINIKRQDPVQYQENWENVVNHAVNILKT